MNLYLYPLGAWGLATLGLWFTDYGQWAIPLCYPLGFWQIGLSAVWGTRLMRRVDRGEVSNAEASEGIRTVGHILAGSSLAPAILFLANDPIAPQAWSTTVGCAVVGGLTVLALRGLIRVATRWSHAVALAAACLALPINATGTVTVATMLGLYDVVVEVTPLPDELKPPTIPLDDGTSGRQGKRKAKRRD
ncbi:MAG: hypothetical protein KC656_20050 [Myxococcales bacterium]|nr:hypothetical protein [Myxococcales bacterium]